MVAYIIAMVKVILGRCHHPVKFREEYLCHACFIQGAQFLRVAGNQELYQFCLYPLLADIGKVPCKGRDYFFGAPFYGKAKLRGKTDSPHQAQGILRKTLYGVAHTLDFLVFQVPGSAKRVHQAFFVIVCHSVDGKVPAF